MPPTRVLSSCRAMVRLRNKNLAVYRRPHTDMERILNDKECDLLEKIARRSKMDTWFWIDENGIVKDAERQSKSQRKLIYQLIEGLIREDWEDLSGDEKWELLQIAAKVAY